MSTIESTRVETEIAAFVLAVGDHLDDLPAEEVDELVDDLATDLAEQAADSGADFSLPDAAAYADELRAAAGLPPRNENTKAPGLRAVIVHRVSAKARVVRSHPAVATAVDFLVSLRPAWWLVRALVVFEAVTVFARGTWLALDLWGLLLLAACVISSVQWGRKRWLPKRGAEWVVGVVNVAAWLMLPILIVGGLNSYAQSQLYGPGSVVGFESQPGLTNDGTRVRNIFAYDADGQPLTGVQLFDQDGNALTTVGREGLNGDWEADIYFLGGGGPVPVPERGAGFRAIWNVYPLAELPPYEDPWSGSATAATPRPPFAQVPVIEPAASASPGPAVTVTPRPGPSETASADPAETAAP